MIPNLTAWAVPAVILTFMGVTLGPFLIQSARGWRVRRHLLRTGHDAMGTLIRTWGTGVTINDDPQVGMLVEVHPPGGEPFRAEATVIIPLVHLPMAQAGARVYVRYDPAAPGRVAVVSLVGTAATPDGPMAITLVGDRDGERLLMQHQATNLEILRIGTPAPAKVLEYTPTGIEVNGPNPVVNVAVEVHPPGSPPFTAQSFGQPVVAASIPRYQPGCMVTVRYDATNTPRVVVERSGA
ncbi:MAG: DUF3592 domain-containing protein [Gemmatimonadetes bacterium]|nr:DUF3592 domain-containing protein [Gemmatimonadota bacterium]